MPDWQKLLLEAQGIADCVEAEPFAKTGIITAWRGWRVVQGHKGDAVLASLNDRMIWAPRRPCVARCRTEAFGFGRVRSHAAPKLGCTCGIYALDLEEGKGQLFSYQGDGILIGRVALWGVYVRATLGWKAQFAYPISFDVFSGRPTLAADPHIHAMLWRLARLYKVPLSAEKPEYLESRWKEI